MKDNKIGEVYYFSQYCVLAILGNIKPDMPYSHRLFILKNTRVYTDNPALKSELTHILLNNPINKLLYPEYIEKGDFLYEKNITANFTIHDYYKLRNSYNARKS